MCTVCTVREKTEANSQISRLSTGVYSLYCEGENRGQIQPTKSSEHRCVRTLYSLYCEGENRGQIQTTKSTENMCVYSLYCEVENRGQIQPTISRLSPQKTALQLGQLILNQTKTFVPCRSLRGGNVSCRRLLLNNLLVTCHLTKDKVQKTHLFYVVGTGTHLPCRLRPNSFPCLIVFLLFVWHRDLFLLHKLDSGGWEGVKFLFLGKFYHPSRRQLPLTKKHMQLLSLCRGGYFLLPNREQPSPEVLNTIKRCAVS